MNLNSFFPLTRRVSREDSRSLIAVVIIYLVACAAVKIADWLLSWVPLVGMILSVAFWIIGAYCAVGIVIAILEYFRAKA